MKNHRLSKVSQVKESTILLESYAHQTALTRPYDLAVLISFIRPRLLDTDITRLTVGEYRKFGAEFLELQTRNFFADHALPPCTPSSTAARQSSDAIA